MRSGDASLVGFSVNTVPRPALYTIGHSIRPIGEFLRLLMAHAIERVADVRSAPRSRHNPQYASEALAAALHRAGIEYFHLPRLGGLRKPLPDSRNTGLTNSGFRGFADYMATQEFEAGLVELLALAADKRTAMMCAEAVWWRCHRSLISDALVSRGAEVRHILGEGRPGLHRLTRSARVRGGRLAYPPRRPPLF